ncbi:DUF4255 domain-containing protein [Piscinibacter sp.]|uniref:DUF4255 domain-containing protein n=1 Tax=Piscinibacter sp. TaxID=1903157 RepID=UPI002C2BE7A9|nr:DUF4255 domain-containing protein [Albitalea sp.]HUG26174.1 DUF4255 domain-containing protein [Albitalea sp.]
MIDAAIGQIAQQLNQALRRSFQVGEDLVVVSNLHEQDGTVASHVANKLVVFLVNIERESVPMPGERAASGLGRIGMSNAPIHLNPMVMFAANFGGSNYPEALKFISSAISFFQGRPVFDHQNTPELDGRIDRLVLEMEPLSVSDLSNLWGILSGKYVPSVLYRMRMVTIDSAQLTSQAPRVSRPSAGVHA